MPRIAMPREAPKHDEARQEILHAMLRQEITGAELIRRLNEQKDEPVPGNTIYRYLRGDSDSLQSLVTRIRKTLGMTFKGVGYEKV